MRMRLATKVMIGSSGVLMSLIASGGIASAAPDNEAIVNSNCTYPQIIGALQDQDPAVAKQITGNPMAVGYLQQFVASAPQERRNLIAQAQTVPAIVQYTGLINTVASSCSKY